MSALVHTGERVVTLAIQRLNTDPTLVAMVPGGIWRDGLAQGSAYPRVLVSPAYSVDVTTANGSFVHSNDGVLVKVIGDADYDQIQPVADRCAFRLQGYGGTVEGVYVAKFSRFDSPPQEPIHEGGVVYPVLNQRFRAPAHPV